jgi:hypothetical protein
VYSKGGEVMKELNDYQKLIVDRLLTQEQNKILNALKDIGFPSTTNYESLVVDLSEVIKIKELLNIPRAKI